MERKINNHVFKFNRKGIKKGVGVFSVNITVLKNPQTICMS